MFAEHTRASIQTTTSASAVDGQVDSARSAILFAYSADRRGRKVVDVERLDTATLTHLPGLDELLASLTDDSAAIAAMREESALRDVG